jgi:hypothetical protein
MNADLPSWLKDLQGFQGLLGACVAPPHQRPQVRSWSGDCTEEGISALHRQVQDVVDVLESQQMPARKLRWIFDRSVVYFERRKDGAGMCLITSHDPWIGDGENITRLIDEFRGAA